MKITNETIIERSSFVDYDNKTLKVRSNHNDETKGKLIREYLKNMTKMFIYIHQKVDSKTEFSYNIENGLFRATYKNSNKESVDFSVKVGKAFLYTEHIVNGTTTTQGVGLFFLIEKT